MKFAAGNGHLEVVKHLASQGADAHARNDGALRLASDEGHLEVVKYLVSQGANVHTEGDYALKWACDKGHLEVVKCLIGAGADVRSIEVSVSGGSLVKDVVQKLLIGIVNFFVCP